MVYGNMGWGGQLEGHNTRSCLLFSLTHEKIVKLGCNWAACYDEPLKTVILIFNGPCLLTRGFQLVLLHFPAFFDDDT